MTAVVTSWRPNHLHLPHPVMTIGSTAAPSVALATIAAGLVEEGLWIRYAGTESFTARYLGWRGWRHRLS